MRILITGASGMLGSNLVEQWQNKFDVYSTDKNNFNENSAKNFMTFDLISQSYKTLMDWARPQFIIHCAAITNLDYCEENPEQAMAVNAESINKFLEFDNFAKMIFISSDAVFPDGLHMAFEKHATAPENVYGKTKEAGEKIMRVSSDQHLAIRTTIVGININSKKRAFVEWIINSIKNRKEITLFDDALFTPISVWHLGEELEWIIFNNISGIIHIAGLEAVSKYDFGQRICKKLGMDTNLILKGSIEEVSFKAKRSKDQTLKSTYYQQLSGRTLPTMDETVASICERIKEFSYEKYPN